MTTEKGIYYPTDYSDVADIPADMQEMAESIDNALTSSDGEIEGIKEEQQTQNTQINNNKTDIEAIKIEQTEQNTDIQANTDNITALQDKVDLLESLIPTDTASGESLTLSNTARYPFKEFNVGGNTKQATAILPDEYQQVDYIESSGTQYIDTGVLTNNNIKVQAKAVSTFGLSNGPLTYSAALLGARKSGPSSYLGYTSGVNNDFIGNGTEFIEIPRNVNQDLLTLEYDNNSVNISCGNYSYSNNSLSINITDSFNIYLLAINQDNTAISLGTYKLYTCKIYDNDTLVRDFIPCYRKSDNVVGLYDLVNNVFYTNAGTGAFTYGAAVTIPNPSYPQEIENVSGEVEVKVANGTDSTATGYEEQTATLHLPEGMEMCKIGDYKDSFVEQDGKWYKNKKIGKVVFTGTENWRLINQNQSNAMFGNLYNSVIVDYLSASDIYYCNYFKDYGAAEDAAQALASGVGMYKLTSSTAKYFYFTIAKSLASTLQEWLSWLASHNVIVYYIFKNPALEEITDPTLISDLESLKNLYSYKGTTYISSSNEPSPVFEVVYRKELESIANS